MKNKKLTVAIGIPAYNEETNIRPLLESLLRQKLSAKVELQEIIVISDGSSDKTVGIVKSVKNPLIKIITKNTRLGQQVRQNQLIATYKGDILVIIEADTLPYNNTTINNLVLPYLRNHTFKLGMVVGQAVTVSPTTWVEKIDTHGHNLKQNLFREWKDGNNLYSVGGHAMKALSKKFTTQLKWPVDVPEDSYAYFRLKELGMKMVKQSNAMAFVKRASNLKDYIRRNKKFVCGKKILKKYFPKDSIEQEFKPPLNLVIKHTFLEFSNSPGLTILYLLVSLLVRVLNFKAKEFNHLYLPFSSTKDLSASKEVA